MRLPWGKLATVGEAFLSKQSYGIIGCLSPEYRCVSVPMRIACGPGTCQFIRLLEIHDPDDAFPNYSTEAKAKRDENRIALDAAGVRYDSTRADLLDADGKQLKQLAWCLTDHVPETVVLDITAFPKRYFALYLKKLMLRSEIQNLIITYSVPSPGGYSDGHLASDPLPCDHLPGFAAPPPDSGSCLLASMGFEPLNLKGILSMHRAGGVTVKIVLPFPPDGIGIRRAFNSLRNLASHEAAEIGCNTVYVVSTWDAEYLYRQMGVWQQGYQKMYLLPFGPKPHTLGMVLYAIKHNCGIYYTQPKSYSPNYSQGAGDSWVYVVKWEGIPCYERYQSGT
jgi:hypothetical protein